MHLGPWILQTFPGCLLCAAADMCSLVQANILAAIAWLVKDCQASDSLFFSFSGHGCQPPHPNGGSWDEGILPCDFQQVILTTPYQHKVVQPH